MPRVSIVVAFLDAEQFLAETLQSVVAQTFTDWELILVDDGSRDSSTEIARDLAAHDSRVRYIDHPGHTNCGLSRSRNVGTEAASADVIATLDADDVWLSHKLQDQLILLDQNLSTEMIFGRAQYWRSWQGGEDTVPDPDFPPGLYEPPRLLLETFHRVDPPPPSDLLFRRTLWQRVGGFDSDFRGMYEDQVFLVKCFRSAPVFVASATWTQYRRHSSSMESSTMRDANSAYLERIRFLRWLAHHLGDDPVPEVRRAVSGVTWAVRHPTLHRALWRTRRAFARD